MASVYIDIKTMHTEYLIFRCSLKKGSNNLLSYNTYIKISKRYLIDIALYLYKLILKYNRIFETKYTEAEYFS